MDLVVLPPWIPEDDLLLKNAVEAGASLESLAKGAVRFSRKYSIAELRERWWSLLYDPDVAAEASASMANLELSGKSAGTGVKEGTGDGASAKRKGPSIRKQYYAMRKRLCRQDFDSSHMARHDEMNVDKNSESGRIDPLNKDMNNLIADNLVDCGSYSGLEDVGPSHSMSDVPLWKTIEDVLAPAMPVQVSPENKDHDREEARATLPHGLKGKCASDALNASAAMPGEDVARLSYSLLDFANDDELLFVDVDGKDAADKSCYENVDSLLLSSPCEIQGNDASDICESRKLHTEAKAAVMPSSSSAAGLEVVANALDGCHGDVPSASDPGNNAESSVSAQTPHPESNEECKFFCMLNAEDSDVPSDDSTDSSIVVPHLFTPKSQPIVKEAGYADSSTNNQRKKEPERSLKKEDNTSHSSASSQPQIVRAGLVPHINSGHPAVGVVVKAKIPGRNPISEVSRQSNNVNINLSHSRLAYATIVPATDGHLKQKEIDTSASAKVHAHPRAEQHKDLPESEVKSLSLNQERDDDNDDDSDDDDCDNEVPSFSDAEAMILEMDLCPTDQDTNASREVLRYQHAETKRTIMRLEQCAQSFMQRAIASQGAFAVFYGRNLKQYINKSKVILGRGSDDVRVDIDLRREGCAKKISRRQALIKMEANGSFIIKNLGKSSIFLNGKEVATGQLRGLNASSLIEIGGMSFIFETSIKSVRSFLGNMDNKGEDKRKAFTMVA